VFHEITRLNPNKLIIDNSSKKNTINTLNVVRFWSIYFIYKYI